jgi:protein phosphatase
MSNLAFAELTDIGRRRQNNEDSILSLPLQRVFCVADGMGGMDYGELASKLVVDNVKDALSAERIGGATPDLAGLERLFVDSVSRANERIRGIGREHSGIRMGSTVAAVMVDPVDGHCAVTFHAGDSRVYLYRAGILEAKTRDHTVGEQIGAAANRLVGTYLKGAITRCVGVTDTVELERQEFGLRNNDILMVCSDGLHGQVPLDSMASIFRSHEAEPLGGLAAELVAEANRRGGKDNVSVILVRVTLGPAEEAQTTGMRPSPTATATQTKGEPVVFLRLGRRVPPWAAVALCFAAVLAWSLRLLEMAGQRPRPAQPGAHAVTPTAHRLPATNAAAAVNLARPDPARLPEIVGMWVGSGDWADASRFLEEWIDAKVFASHRDLLSMVEPWVKEWRRVKGHISRTAEKEFRDKYDGVTNSLAIARVATPAFPQVQWPPAPGEGATVYCREHRRLHLEALRLLREEVERLRETAALATDPAYTLAAGFAEVDQPADRRLQAAQGRIASGLSAIDGARDRLSQYYADVPMGSPLPVDIIRRQQDALAEVYAEATNLVGRVGRRFDTVRGGAGFRGTGCWMGLESAIVGAQGRSPPAAGGLVSKDDMLALLRVAKAAADCGRQQDGGKVP